MANISAEKGINKVFKTETRISIEWVVLVLL